jgi:hypothetical protein
MKDKILIVFFLIGLVMGYFAKREWGANVGVIVLLGYYGSVGMLSIIADRLSKIHKELEINKIVLKK